MNTTQQNLNGGNIYEKTNLSVENNTTWHFNESHDRQMHDDKRTEQQSHQLGRGNLTSE